MWFQEWAEDEGCGGDWIGASNGAREVKTEPEAGLSQGKKENIEEKIGLGMQNFWLKKFEFGIQKIQTLNGCLKYWHISNVGVVTV